MGYGDEIIGSGLARGAHARGKMVAFGRSGQILWSDWCKEVYENNPNVARPGQEKLQNLEWIGYHKGSRGYSKLSPDGNRWIWNYEHRMRPGEFFFSDLENKIADGYGSGFIVIEPNLPWHKSVAVNKDWGASRYVEVARRLRLQGHRLVQFRHKYTRLVLEGAEIIQLPRQREAISVMSRASLFMGAEGGMMHAAAAVGIRGVVIFGGWSPPVVCGYHDHVNLVGTDEACGNLRPCDHCRKALDKITVEEATEAVVRQL